MRLRMIGVSSSLWIKWPLGLAIALLLSFSVGCDEASFQATEKQPNRAKPSVKQPPPTGSNAVPELGDGTPDDTNCTGLTEQECHNKKQDEGSNTSHRIVDCMNKSAIECKDAVNQTKIDDGSEGSRIVIKNCQDDLVAKCQTIKDENPDVTLDSDQGDEGGDIKLGQEDKIVTKFQFNQNVALDGISYIEFNFETGVFNFGSTDQKFGLVRFQFDYEIANGVSGFVSQNGYKVGPTPARQGASSGTATIPDWPKQCGATPTPVPQLLYNYTGGGTRKRKPKITINVSGSTVRMDIDDSLGDRGGAVSFQNLDLHLQPCT